MAQRVNIVLVDDLDGGDADETVTFGLDGATYEIDLSSANAQQLREALALYVGQARRVSGSSARRAGGRRSASAEGPSAREIRAWARENGWKDLGDRGRVPGEVREAYAAAH